MKAFVSALFLTTALVLPAAASNKDTCAEPAIKNSPRISTDQCACRLKGADKYLSRGDKAYLIQYWSGQRNDQPHIYLGTAYPSGKNKPLIKYNAYIAKKCG